MRWPNTRGVRKGHVIKTIATLVPRIAWAHARPERILPDKAPVAIGNPDQGSSNRVSQAAPDADARKEGKAQGKYLVLGTGQAHALVEEDLLEFSEGHFLVHLIQCLGVQLQHPCAESGQDLLAQLVVHMRREW